MRSRSGFTIVELLGALVLIAITAAIAIPAYFGRSEVTLEHAAILLGRDFRAAQNRAAYQAEPSHFQFLEDGRGYIVTDPGGSLSINPSTNQPFERIYAADGVFRGVRVVDVRFGPDRTLVYDERGIPAQEGQVTLWFRGDKRIVKVQRRTGTVEIVGSTSGWTDPGY